MRKTAVLSSIIAVIFISLILLFSNSIYIDLGKNQLTPELISELPNKNTYIYGFREKFSGGVYPEILLKVGSKNSVYKWRSMRGSFAPRLKYADLDGNGNNELIIILTEAEGTGVLKSVVHVLDPSNLKEVPVEDPLKIIDHVDSSIVHSGGKVTVSVTVQGQRIEKVFSEDYSPAWIKDKPAFGSIVKYDVIDKTLIATVPVQISAAGFWGEIFITYGFIDDKYIMKDIKFTE